MEKKNFKAQFSLGSGKSARGAVFFEMTVDKGQNIKVMDRQVFDRAIDSAGKKLEELNKKSDSYFVKEKHFAKAG